ncbi:uncharacterized protein N7503_005724 [Penicillium pulvis]|uniref:uncharacterized protein n=1 Tax=Penicillium pulvis TaxID=1562058 RepID=UPI0025494548|nr:uncharacterized protein N7503_005724 [Penicillium pulvis]KAJ5803274.1 hypothetical protein N7503_005724 [Penicillium pulvis]
MAPTELLTRPAELWQQSTNKMHRSTTDIWRRSTNLWYDSKHMCHQTTMDVWHRSSDSVTNSMNRCLQSTDKLTTAAKKLQTTGNEAKVVNEAPIASAKIDPSTIPAPSLIPNTPYSPESVGSPEPTKPLPSIQTIQYIPYSKPSSRSRSQSESDTNSTSSSSLSIDLDLDKKNAADQQTKDLIELTKKIDTDLEQAKQLRDSKSSQLGEIEHNWINSTINDAKDSNQEMTQILSSYRLIAEKRKGKLGLSSRKRWRTQDCQRVREKYPRLVLHQSRLEKVLTHLTTTPASPDFSPEEPTGASLSELPLCEATVKSLVELPVEFEVAASLPVIAELPSESLFPANEQGLIGELPAVSSSIRRKTMLPIPRIIVTQAVEDLSAEQSRSKEMDENEFTNYENKEMDEMMAWEKTRNDIQMQQSESLARIFAEMEKKSMH